MNKLELQMPNQNRHEVGLALLELASQVLRGSDLPEGGTYKVTTNIPSPCVIKPTTEVNRDITAKGLAKGPINDETYSVAMSDVPEEGLTLSELATALSVEDMADITARTTALGVLVTDVVGVATKDGLHVTAKGKEVGIYQGDYAKKHRERKSGRELAVLGGDIDPEIIHMYQEGRSVKSIQNEFNKSAGYIYSVLNNNKVPKRNKQGEASVQRKLKAKLEDPLFITSVISDYEGGIPLGVIYSKYGLYKNALYYILDVYNVPRRINK